MQRFLVRWTNDLLRRFLFCIKADFVFRVNSI